MDQAGVQRVPRAREPPATLQIESNSVSFNRSNARGWTGAKPGRRQPWGLWRVGALSSTNGTRMRWRPGHWAPRHPWTQPHPQPASTALSRLCSRCDSGHKLRRQPGQRAPPAQPPPTHCNGDDGGGCRRWQPVSRRVDMLIGPASRRSRLATVSELARVPQLVPPPCRPRSRRPLPPPRS